MWQEKPQAMAISQSAAIPRHPLRQAIESHNGFVCEIIGDSFCAAFHNAYDGLRTATLRAAAAATGNLE
ncbi:MAG: hypothetical protein MZV70_16280 [Desulfobacterales bacterium]|nr:hypothetical protein [Desulfobacterales bacterium]